MKQPELIKRGLTGPVPDQEYVIVRFGKGAWAPGPWDKYYGEESEPSCLGTGGRALRGQLGYLHGVKTHTWQDASNTWKAGVYVGLPWSEVIAMYDSPPEWGEFAP